MLTLHPRFEIDEQAGVLRASETATGSQRLPAGAEDGTDADQERTEPDRPVYADLLLLVDALERHDVDALEALETPVLVNLYTLLSDVQRGTDDLRKEVADRLLDRIHHDQPVHGQFGSVQRTTREYRLLKDDQDVLATLENAGIDPEHSRPSIPTKSMTRWT